MIKVFTGTFQKKNSDTRNMTFVKLEDLPKDFLNSKVKNENSSRTLPAGLELVWDIDSAGFRTFNWQSAVGDVKVEILKGKEKDDFETKHLTEQK